MQFDELFAPFMSRISIIVNFGKMRGRLPLIFYLGYTDWETPLIFNLCSLLYGQERQE